MSTNLLTPKSNLAKTKKSLIKILYIIIALIVIAIVLFPLLLIIPNAWKSSDTVWNDLVEVPLRWLPKTFIWDNFIEVFKVTRYYDFFGSLFSTMLVALLATFGSLFINTLAAYAFARIDFPFKKLLWVLYLFPMFVPGIAILITSLKVVRALDMPETIFVLFVPSLASAYQTFFFRQFFLGVPAAYEEAAEMDGCNKFSIYWRIFLPMAKTPLIIQGVGIFMAHWNSYLWPSLTVTKTPELKQVMQVIFGLWSDNSMNYGVIIAASLVSMLPPLIIFAFAQKEIVQGATLSGIK